MLRKGISYELKSRKHRVTSWKDFGDFFSKQDFLVQSWKMTGLFDMTSKKTVQRTIETHLWSPSGAHSMLVARSHKDIEHTQSQSQCLKSENVLNPNWTWIDFRASTVVHTPTSPPFARLHCGLTAGLPCARHWWTPFPPPWKKSWRGAAQSLFTLELQVWPAPQTPLCVCVCAFVWCRHTHTHPAHRQDSLGLNERL